MSRRVFVLLAHDPTTGWASAPVGALGLAGNDWSDGGEQHLSWVPYHRLAEPWRQRLGATSVPLAQAVGEWASTADGVGWDLAEVDSPPSPDLRGAVEAVVDDILAGGLS
ncbi:MAG: hypothetical protein M3404_01555 [Actinomycetota bacterium]|nr:hypothetical protein [Actinomycetota bacterium]